MDVMVCGLSVMTLVAFTKTPASVSESNSDIEESITIDSTFIRSKHLKLNTHILLEGIGKWSMDEKFIIFEWLCSKF